MAVRVQCSHCGAACQIQEQHVGANVKCPKCTKVFTARADGAAATQSSPAVAPAPPPAPASSASAPAASSPPKPAAAPPAPPPPSAPPPAPAAPAATANAPPPPPPPPSGTTTESAAAEKPSAKRGFWSGVQGLFKKGAKSESAAPAKAASSPAPPSTSTGGDADDEMGLGLDLDAAALEILKQQEDADKKQEPKLGTEPPGIHGHFRLDIGGATTVGRVRDRNEDSFLIQQASWTNLDSRHDAALVVVADGMGGHQAGDRASLLAIQEIGNSLRTALGGAPGGAASNGPLRGTIEAAIKSANSVVHQTAQKEAPGKGMGATGAIVAVRDGQAEIGHVGDCRVYLFHDGDLMQVTRDQTLVARMLELGQLTPQEAKNHPKANEVTQAIGKGPDIQPAYYNLRLVPGDWLVVACDGLHAHVDAAKLTETLGAAPLSAALVAHHLVDLANFLGGSDNCTVVALRCY